MGGKFFNHHKVTPEHDGTTSKAFTAWLGSLAESQELEILSPRRGGPRLQAAQFRGGPRAKGPHPLAVPHYCKGWMNGHLNVSPSLFPRRYSQHHSLPRAGAVAEFGRMPFTSASDSAQCRFSSSSLGLFCYPVLLIFSVKSKQ